MAKKPPKEKKEYIYDAKDYNHRHELEEKIRFDFNGNFDDNNKKAIIKGTKKQLKKLHLSQSTNVYGINVEKQ